MPKHKIEYLYDNRKDKTTIYIWMQTKLVDTRELNGQVSSEHQKKINKSIEREFKKEE